jgi:hypothetical protein
MTPRERVLAVLRHETAGSAPFTAYESKVPQCTAERILRNRGMCGVMRTTSYDIAYPNARITTHGYRDDRGRELIRTDYETPAGTLTDLREPAGFTTWTREWLFKTPDDYKPLLYLLKDATVIPNYGRPAKLEKELGGDFIVRDQVGYEPLQAVLSAYMGTETFCYEWMDNRDEVLTLYEAIAEMNRKIYGVVAEGPLTHANYGGNVTPSVIGRDAFRNYYLPHYHEFSSLMRRHGKLAGSHFDADNTTIIGDIAGTELDYIEAYDLEMNPSLTLAQAQNILGDKILWLNWPSAWHLYDLNEIRGRTLNLLREGRGKNLIIGITETVPEDRWQANFSAIMDGIDDYNAERN